MDFFSMLLNKLTNSSDCGGAVYESIVYNEDNTITLTDKNGVVHTMERMYTDGKITSIKYDGKAVEITYDGDLLVKVGNTNVVNTLSRTDLINAIYQKMGVNADDYPYMTLVYDKNNNRVSCGVISKDPNNGYTGNFPQYSEGFVFLPPNKYIEDVNVDDTSLNAMLNSVANSSNNVYSGTRQVSGSTIYINYDEKLIDLTYKKSTTEIVHFE